jgi:hypothetical protein
MTIDFCTWVVIGAPVESLLAQPPAAVSEVGQGPEYFRTPAVGGRADAT